MRSLILRRWPVFLLLLLDDAPHIGHFVSPPKSIFQIRALSLPSPAAFPESDPRIAADLINKISTVNGHADLVKETAVVQSVQDRLTEAVAVIDHSNGSKITDGSLEVTWGLELLHHATADRAAQTIRQLVDEYTSVIVPDTVRLASQRLVEPQRVSLHEIQKATRRYLSWLHTMEGWMTQAAHDLRNESIQQTESIVAARKSAERLVITIRGIRSFISGEHQMQPLRLKDLETGTGPGSPWNPKVRRHFSIRMNIPHDDLTVLVDVPLFHESMERLIENMFAVLEQIHNAGNKLPDGTPIPEELLKVQAEVRYHTTNGRPSVDLVLTNPGRLPPERLPNLLKVDYERRVKNLTQNGVGLAFANLAFAGAGEELVMMNSQTQTGVPTVVTKILHIPIAAAAQRSAVESPSKPNPPRSEEPVISAALHALPPATAGLPRILLVDDEEGIRKMLSAMLRQKGYIVDDFATGTDAVAAATKQPYQMVITDFGLTSHMACRELIEKLIALHSPAAIIVMSGAHTAMVKKALSGIGVYVLAKPFRSDKLFETIEIARKHSAADGPAAAESHDLRKQS